MNRVKTGGYGAAIAASFDLIPAALHDLIRPEFLCGSDPVFAGLHRYESTTDGRSYRNTAHCTYDFHQMHLPRARRSTTVVLPVVPSVRTVVHELGHVLHESLLFEPQVRPVTWYAQTNWCEAFAEAFTSWVLPGEHGYGPAKDRLLASDPAAVALLDQLAAS